MFHAFAYTKLYIKHSSYHSSITCKSNKELKLEIKISKQPLQTPAPNQTSQTLLSRVVTVWDFDGMIIISENISVSRYHGIRY